MYKPPSIRIGFVPKTDPAFSASQVISQPDIHGRWSSRVSPWTMSTGPINFNSSSSIQWTRSYDNFHNQSSLSLLDNNKQSLEKDRKISKNITTNKVKYSSWLSPILVTFFAMVGLAALVIAIYTFLLVQAMLRTTISTTTTSTTTTTTAFSFLWNSSGTTVAGITSIPGNLATQLYTPYGLALNASKTLYIAEWDGNRVSKWPMGSSSGKTVAGQASGTPGTASNAFNHAGDVVVDISGNCYVADAGNHRIQFWSVGATSGITVAGTSGSPGSANNQLNSPYSLARNSNTGTLYISDTANHRVMQYFVGATSGNVVAGGNGPGVSPTQLYTPTGIYFDSLSDSLIIANYQANNIVRWVIGAASWTLLAGSPIGTPGVSSTLLQYPMDVTLDPMGNIYVADTVNSRIQLFFAGQSRGITIAGISVGSGPTQLLAPYDIALDDDLNLYVSDTGNHRVQKFNRY